MADTAPYSISVGEVFPEDFPCVGVELLAFFRLQVALIEFVRYHEGLAGIVYVYASFQTIVGEGGI